ncbi:MAG: glycerol-3-phosphate 1-O-acyltransferase PlsY [Clostridia bacterium]|nr:glycerol-3-phosphate 1-O-acyltransferase PlsY [Clostridia bacterium]
MTVFTIILCGVIGYLLGSVNSSVVVGKYIFHNDVREQGSKNAGLTNTLRVLGKKAALMVLAGDILKGVLACLFGSLINPQYGAVIGGLFAVLGHNWPLYFNFKGGKGVLTSATVIMMWDWKIGLISLALFILVVFLTRYVSLGSMIAAVSLVVVSLIMDKGAFFIISGAILAGLIIYRHKANISRLLKGEENKLNLKKSKE